MSIIVQQVPNLEWFAVSGSDGSEMIKFPNSKYGVNLGLDAPIGIRQMWNEIAFFLNHVWILNVKVSKCKDTNCPNILPTPKGIHIHVIFELDNDMIIPYRQWLAQRTSGPTNTNGQIVFQPLKENYVAFNPTVGKNVTKQHVAITRSNIDGSFHINPIDNGWVIFLNGTENIPELTRWNIVKPGLLRQIFA